MKRLFCIAFPLLVVVIPLSAQQKAKPVLVLHCTADKVSVAQRESVNLTISLENRGPEDISVYGILEWGWAGIGYTLTNDKGVVMHLKENRTPPPPPPVYDKSQFVGLAPGYFFGTHVVFNLSHYALRPGAYFIQVSYQSNYKREEGFGLPILTVEDGEFRSEKIKIQVH